MSFVVNCNGRAKINFAGDDLVIWDYGTVAKRYVGVTGALLRWDRCRSWRRKLGGTWIPVLR